jgi:hypothetical protein
MSTAPTRKRCASRFEANLAHGEAALAAAQRQMAVLDTEEGQLRVEAKAKQAAFDLAKIELGYTRITAPIDGMVSERGVRAGQYVHDGTQVISVVPLHNVWVVANYKETQLTHVKIGQRAEITVDTFPGVVVTGRVDSISPASGSQFTLLPPDNATGNFTTRRFLLWTSVIFAATSLLVPFTRDYSTIIALQVLRGLTVGAFIPASLGFILRSLAPRWWIWGLAAYAFRFVFSQTIAGSIEALYSESGAWQWILWQNAVFTPVITALVWYAMPREGINRALLQQTD